MSAMSALLQAERKFRFHMTGNLMLGMKILCRHVHLLIKGFSPNEGSQDQLVTVNWILWLFIFGNSNVF